MLARTMFRSERIRIVQYFALLLLAVMACSCGGGAGGTGSIGNSPLAATYRSQFTRGVAANTNLILFIQGNGHVGAQISDGTGVLWAGTGTVFGNSVNAGLTPVSSSVTGNVLLTGTVQAGAPPTLNISLSGAVTDSFTATQLSGTGVLPLAHTYTFTTDGDEKGSGSFSIDGNGNVTGTLNSPTFGNGLSMDGTVDLTGHAVIHVASINANGTLNGYMFLAPGATLWSGNGTFSLNTLNGTWQATQMPTP